MKRGSRSAEPDAEGVAVQRAQAFDFAVVVEGRFSRRDSAGARTGRGSCRSRACTGRALPLRVVVPLDRVDVVLRGEFTLAALEGRVVIEVDAGTDANGVGRVVRRDLGQRDGRVRAHPDRPRQEFERVRGIEDVRGDGARIQVGDLRRIEAGLGDAKRVPQHLGLRRDGGGRNQHQRGERDRCKSASSEACLSRHLRLAVSRSPERRKRTP